MNFPISLLFCDGVIIFRDIHEKLEFYLVDNSQVGKV